MRVSVQLVLWAAVAVTAACDVRVGDNGVSVGVAGGKATDTWERTYTLEPGSRLEIVADSGPMNVTGVEGSQATVRIHLEARAPTDEGAREALKSLEILETAGSDAVQVEARAVRGRPGGRPRVSQRFEIQVPGGLESTFRTQNGGIQLEGVRGRMTVSATNGGVTGSGLAGAVSASAVNGGLQLQLTSVTDPMEVSVVNGGVRLELGPEVAAEIVASALNGGVSVGDGLALESSESPRGFGPGSRVTGTLRGGGPRITVNATNGGVRLVGRPDVER